MIDIAVKNVEKYYGANHVLKGVTFELKKGEKAALLGKNGAGKTTLFRVIAGLEGCDAGEVMISKGAGIGLLEQIPEFPGHFSAYDVLYMAFEKVFELHRQMEELERSMQEDSAANAAMLRYGKLQQAFEACGGYQVEEKIEKICKGLKIDREMADKKFRLLSGGEKTRVILGKMILKEPDILLLDEPTNHLDLSAIEWLEGYLETFKGTVLVISHDRYFLDRVVTKTVEIEQGKTIIYEGNYSHYAKEKEERLLQQLEKYTEEQKKIKQLEAAAKRMHEWARRADNPAMHRRAFNIEKRVERMEKTDKPVSERKMETQFNSGIFSGMEVIRLKDVAKAFEHKAVLRQINFTLYRNEKAAVLGDNGSGKTTLVRIITGEIAPDSGTAKVGESIRYAYLPQVVTFEQPSLSVLDTVRHALRVNEGTGRNLLARYRFRDENVLKTVGNLSGGEKSRLRLCIMMQAGINLLVLDEPTNHLDIDSREWLEEALSEFDGTILFISHDRYFINRFATRIVELADGQLADYCGNYASYKESKHRKEQDKPKKTADRRVEEKPEKIPGKTADMEARRVERLEKSIGELEAELEDIERDMQLKASDYESLQGLLRRKGEIEGRVDELYREWAQIAIQ